MSHRLAVVVPTPAHSSISGPLSYLSELPLAPGTLVRVPLGRREVLGVVWDDGSSSARPIAGRRTTSRSPARLDGDAPLTAGVETAGYFFGELLPAQSGRSCAGRPAAAIARPRRSQLARRLKRARAALQTRPRKPRLPTDAASSAPRWPHSRPARTVPAVRRHRQRQDRGLPAGGAAAAGARPAGAGAGDGAGDQPHAAAAGALRRALRRRQRGGDEQRHDARRSA